MKSNLKKTAVGLAAILLLSAAIRLMSPGPDRFKPWWWGVSDADFQRAVREHQAWCDWKAADDDGTMPWR